MRNTLLGKRLPAADLPLSATSDRKKKRYRIADPYLCFWLAFLQRGLPLIEPPSVPEGMTEL